MICKRCNKHNCKYIYKKHETLMVFCSECKQFLFFIPSIEDYEVRNGKYTHMSISEIYNIDSDYINWLAKSNYEVDNKIAELFLEQL